MAEDRAGSPEEAILNIIVIMISDQKHRQVERELGLLSEFFEAKFVYSQQQNCSEEAYLLPWFKPLASQLAGFTRQDVRVIHALGAEMISKAGESLQLPVSTGVLAQTLFHFYFAKIPFSHYDIRDAMIGALYLACKSQQTLRNRYEVVAVFDYIFKSYQASHRAVRAIVGGSMEYEHIKNHTLLKAELDILFQLGFEIYRLLDLPHRYVVSILNLFEKHPKHSEFAKLSWRILNDCYLTTVCLNYPAQIIAAAAVYMAMRSSGAPFPQVAWWSLMESYQGAIQYIESEVNALKECQGLVNLGFASKRINEVSEGQHGLQNVFPVPYYRKITLENQSSRQLKQSRQLTHEDMKEVQSNMKEAQSNMKEAQSNMKEVQLAEKSPQNQMRATPPKEIKQIDKMDLLQKINLTFKKHGDKLEEKSKKERELESDDQEEMRLLSELRKKVKAKKQAEKGNEQEAQGGNEQEAQGGR